MTFDKINERYVAFSESDVSYIRPEKYRKFNYKVYFEGAYSIRYMNAYMEKNRLTSKLHGVALAARGESVKAVGTAIKNHAKNIWEIISKFFKMLWENITQFFRWLWDMEEKIKVSYTMINKTLAEVDKKGPEWSSFLNTEFKDIKNITVMEDPTYSANIKSLDSATDSLLKSVKSIGDPGSLSKRIFSLGQKGSDGLSSLVNENRKASSELKSFLDEFGGKKAKTVTSLRGEEIYKQLQEAEKALSMLVYVKSKNGSTLISKLKEAETFTKNKKNLEEALNTFSEAQEKPISDTVKQTVLDTVKSTSNLLSSIIGSSNRYIGYILRVVGVLGKIFKKNTKVKEKRETIAKVIKKEIVKRALDPKA